MAAMSVIGIDFGTETCYIAVAKAGGIETIANDYSLRGTPSFVAFSQKNRILGVAAKNQMVTNMKNTVFGFKRLLGRKYSDPHVQRELRSFPFRTEPLKDDGIGIRVHYLGEEHVFTPEQLTAMLFTKLKESATIALQTQVNDCVISVPSYFTNAERKALLDAASIAGLNVLRLMNETTATALAYGIYKQDLPAAEEKPRNVVFVDFGYSSLQVAVCAFNRGKLRVLATAADQQCGGRDIDSALADYFVRDFASRLKIDSSNNKRAYLRLIQEVEKVKKQMSANSTKLPINIECFLEERDVSGEMQRCLMEELCADTFGRVERVLRSALTASKLRPEDISSVEIVGGATRVPAVKHLIEQVFGKSPSTTLNQDEAVARGCALQCAILSPAVRVRDFSVTDVQPYAVRLAWDDTDMEVFPTNHPAPFAKMLTFYRKEAFSVSAYYADPVPFPDTLIGKWYIKDIQPNAEGESQKVKLKVRVNIHGIIAVTSATLVERREAEGAEAEGEQDAEAVSNGTEPPPANGEAEDADDKKEKKKKVAVKTIELPVQASTHGFNTHDLNGCTELEGKMQATDRQEKERADARNALEEYVYELRGKLGEGGELHEFVGVEPREQLVARLDSLEGWLYDEGEDQNRQVYSDKLGELKAEGEPIKTRQLEWSLRPGALEDLAHALQLANKAIDHYKAGDTKYAHLPAADVESALEKVRATQGWLDTARRELAGASRTQPPAYTTHQIRLEKQSLESTVNPILNKPKPKEKTPPPATEPPADGPAPSAPSATPGAPNEPMDVD